MRIDTWIGNDLVTVDTDDVWLETFAHWDALVPTETAATIATATVRILSEIPALATREDFARIARTRACFKCGQPVSAGCSCTEDDSHV